MGWVACRDGDVDEMVVVVVVVVCKYVRETVRSELARHDGGGKPAADGWLWLMRCFDGSLWQFVAIIPPL